MGKVESRKSKVESVRLASVARLDRTTVDPRLCNGMPYLSLEDIDSLKGEIDVADRESPKSTKFHFSDRHVLYGKLRPYLRKVARPGFSGICSTDIIPILPEKCLDRVYLYHFLRTDYVTNLASKLAVGVNLPRLSPSQLSTFEIPLPTLPSQRRIAGILDAADALRARRREALAQLDSLLQSAFLHIFGDPVTNPMGWEANCFDDLLTLVQYGPRFYNEAYTPTGVKIVRITDLDFEGNLDFDGMPTLVVSDEDREKFGLIPGDLILARTGATVGKTALIRAGDPKCIAGAYFIRMRFLASVSPLYVQWVMRSAGVQAIIWQKSQQSAQPKFNGPAIRKLPLPVPPLDFQRRFAAKVDSIEQQKGRMRAHLAELDALFASLQSRAFNWELGGTRKGELGTRKAE